MVREHWSHLQMAQNIRLEYRNEGDVLAPPATPLARHRIRHLGCADDPTEPVPMTARAVKRAPERSC